MYYFGQCARYRTTSKNYSFLIISPRNAPHSEDLSVEGQRLARVLDPQHGLLEVEVLRRLLLTADELCNLGLLDTNKIGTSSRESGFRAGLCSSSDMSWTKNDIVYIEKPSNTALK